MEKKPRSSDGPQGGQGTGPGGKPRPKGKRFYYRRRKVCRFCVEKINFIDWKDVKLLITFVPERAKILPRRISGTCTPHQRKLQTAIKRARNIVLLPLSA